MSFLKRWQRPDVAQLLARRDLVGLVEAADHTSPVIRQTARDALRDLSGRDVDEALSQALCRGSCAAAQILGARGDILAAPGLAAALEHPNLSVHQSARAALVALNAVESLTRAFRESPIPKAREMALRGLHELQVDDLEELLSDALEDADPTVRSLGEVAGAFPRALDSPDPALRKSALRALTRRGDPDFESSLLEQLFSVEADVRAWAIQGLGAIWTQHRDRLEQSRVVLESLREDESSLVRSALCSLLGSLDFERPWLREALSDPEATVRNQAADSLGMLKDLESVEGLIVALRLGSWGAARALGATGDPRATQPLCEALFCRDVGDVAAQALGELGDPSAIPDLEDFLVRWKPQPNQHPQDPRGDMLARGSLERLRKVAILGPENRSL